MKHDRLLHSLIGTSPGLILLEDQDLYAYHLEHESSQVNDSSREQSYRESKTRRHDFAARSGYKHRTIRLNELSNAPSSIDTIPYLYGAIRPGGEIELFSSRFIALPVNWFLIGFFDGAVASLVYPLLNVYLGYTGAQMNAVQALFGVPRLFKAVIGFLSDCVPINRQRRKPYMIIGWSILLVFMAALVFLNRPSAHKLDGVVVNSDADSQGPRFVMTMFAGMFGHLLCTVACEGMMIEFAHREGEFGRGRVQCLCIASRFAGEAFGGISTSLALNSAEFGGSFAAAVPVRVIFAAYAFLAASGLVVTWLLVHDEKTPKSSQRIASQLRLVWNVLQKSTTWQITVVGFFVSVAIYYRPFDATSIYVTWLGATSLTMEATSVMSSAGTSIGALLCLAVALEANWKLTIFAAVSVGLVVAPLVEMMTVYDVFRSLTASLVALQVGAILDGVIFVVYLLVVVEVSEPGFEAVIYGILTTTANLAIIASSTVNNIVASSIDLRHDTPAVKDHVMHEFLTKYILRVVAMIFVWLLLPRQKRDLRRRVHGGSSNLLPPIILFAFFALLFGACVTSDILAVFPSTSCLKFAGGAGC